MGFFSFLSSLTPLSAAQQVVEACTLTRLSAAEATAAQALGVEPHLLVKERILFRLAFSLASVAFFHNEFPDSRVREFHTLLDSKAFHYLFTVPGVTGDQAGQLWAEARRDYYVRQPNEIAGVMVARLFQHEVRTTSPQALQAFLELVHGYARDSMVQAGELAKKLRTE